MLVCFGPFKLEEERSVICVNVVTHLSDRPVSENEHSSQWLNMQDEKPRVFDTGHPRLTFTHWTSLGCSNVDPHLQHTTWSVRCQIIRNIWRSPRVAESVKPLCRR